jgi:hypothetical protein
MFSVLLRITISTFQYNRCNPVGTMPPDLARVSCVCLEFSFEIGYRGATRIRGAEPPETLVLQKHIDSGYEFAQI